jgi:hypothetical protein
VLNALYYQKNLQHNFIIVAGFVYYKILLFNPIGKKYISVMGSFIISVAGKNQFFAIK